jgi:hypothetical protein
MMCTRKEYRYLGIPSVKFNSFYGRPQNTFLSPANVRQLITGTIQYTTKSVILIILVTFWDQKRLHVHDTFCSIVSKHAMGSN